MLHVQEHDHFHCFRMSMIINLTCSRHMSRTTISVIGSLFCWSQTYNVNLNILRMIIVLLFSCIYRPNYSLMRNSSERTKLVYVQNFNHIYALIIVEIPPWQKKVMFLVGLVCLFVCLLVSNVTQNVMKRLQ